MLLSVGTQVSITDGSNTLSKGLLGKRGYEYHVIQHHVSARRWRAAKAQRPRRPLRRDGNIN
jgi:hypothetical protein